MSFAKTLAGVQDMRPIRLDAHGENDDALRFYDARGYGRVGTLQFPIAQDDSSASSGAHGGAASENAEFQCAALRAWSY
jgi:hypothetical protein